MAKLKTLTQNQLERWVAQAQTEAGQLPSYVPLLAKADPTRFAVWVQQIDGQVNAVGAVNHPFALMSGMKPFLFLFVLHWFGADAVFDRVGTEPSEQAFNSLEQLITDRGFPRNPMINSGAITLADLLPGEDSAGRCEQLRQWLNQQAGSQFSLDQAMLASVRSLPNSTNRALADLLKQAGDLNAVDEALDTYNQLCCLSGTVADLAGLGQLLAQPQPDLLPTHQQTVNTVMRTCGLYEAAGHYAERLGLPIKSGVSGALLAIIEGEGAIACYSPRLDAVGNPVMGLAVVEQIVQWLKWS